MGCSDSSLHRNLAPNVSCGLGTECYRDISIDCCADTWLLMSFVSVGKVRFMSYVLKSPRAPQFRSLCGGRSVEMCAAAYGVGGWFRVTWK